MIPLEPVTSRRQIWTHGNYMRGKNMVVRFEINLEFNRKEYLGQCGVLYID